MSSNAGGGFSSTNFSSAARVNTARFNLMKKLREKRELKIQPQSLRSNEHEQVKSILTQTWNPLSPSYMFSEHYTKMRHGMRVKKEDTCNDSALITTSGRSMEAYSAIEEEEPSLKIPLKHITFKEQQEQSNTRKPPTKRFSSTVSGFAGSVGSAAVPSGPEKFTMDPDRYELVNRFLGN